MITETVRIIADWLADATNGVAPKLLTVPLDTGVTRVVATIHDSTRSDAVAQGLIPAGITAAYLVSPAANPFSLKTNRNVPINGKASVLIRLAFRNYKTAEAMNHASLMVRALRASLALLESTTAGQTARSRGSMQLVSLDPLDVAQTMEPLDDAWVTHAVICGCDVRELYS